MDLRLEHHRAYWTGFISFFTAGTAIVAMGFDIESEVLIALGILMMGASLYFLPDGLRYFTLPRLMEEAEERAMARERFNLEVDAGVYAEIDARLEKLLTEGETLAGATAHDVASGSPLVERFKVWDAEAPDVLDDARESPITFRSFQVKRHTKVRPDVPYREWSWTLDCIDLKLAELRECVKRIHSRRNGSK